MAHINKNNNNNNFKPLLFLLEHIKSNTLLNKI